MTRLDANRRSVNWWIVYQWYQTIPLQHVFSFLVLGGAMSETLPNLDGVPIIVHRSSVMMTQFDLKQEENK